jgi:signal transduction histidine kinase
VFTDRTGRSNGDLEQFAEAMRRRVDRELIRARLRTATLPGEARANVADGLRRLIDTLQRTPAGARLQWRLDAATDAIAAIPADDLMELMGNLLENAAKWADSRVHIRVAGGDDTVRITIADDGPGVPAAQLHRLGERGLRLDQRRAGSGLGLAIARDISDAYGGALSFAKADAGGLGVEVVLPRAGQDQREKA